MADVLVFEIKVFVADDVDGCSMIAGSTVTRLLLVRTTKSDSGLPFI